VKELRRDYEGARKDAERVANRQATRQDVRNLKLMIETDRNCQRAVIDVERKLREDGRTGPADILAALAFPRTPSEADLANLHSQHTEGRDETGVSGTGIRTEDARSPDRRLGRPGPTTSRYLPRFWPGRNRAPNEGTELTGTGAARGSTVSPPRGGSTAGGSDRALLGGRSAGYRPSHGGRSGG